MVFKAVLLDVDGVLYDSMPNHVRSWQEAFELVKLRLTPKMVYVREGIHDTAFIDSISREMGVRRIPKEKQKLMMKIKRERFDQYPKPSLTNGAKQLVRRIRKSELPIALVTGSFQEQTIKRLKRDFGVPRRVIITSRDVKKGKPNPEPYLAAARKLKVKPKDAVVIENAPLGIRSAHRAGMRCIAVNTNRLPRKLLRKSGAAVIYKDCAAIAAAWSKVIALGTGR
jgi:HAD superfamily hydrolase (TIGR01509 family)